MTDKKTTPSEPKKKNNLSTADWIFIVFLIGSLVVSVGLGFSTGKPYPNQELYADPALTNPFGALFGELNYENIRTEILATGAIQIVVTQANMQEYTVYASNTLVNKVSRALAVLDSIPFTVMVVWWAISKTFVDGWLHPKVLGLTDTISIAFVVPNPSIQFRDLTEKDGSTVTVTLTELVCNIRFKRITDDADAIARFERRGTEDIEQEVGEIMLQQVGEAFMGYCKVETMFQQFPKIMADPLKHGITDTEIRNEFGITFATTGVVGRGRIEIPDAVEDYLAAKMDGQAQRRTVVELFGGDENIFSNQPTAAAIATVGTQLRNVNPGEK